MAKQSFSELQSEVPCETLESAPRTPVSKPEDPGWLRRRGGPFDQVPSAQWDDWRWQVRHRFTDPADVLTLLRSGPDPTVTRRVADAFAFSVTPSYLNLVDPQNPHDPILRQVLPDQSELESRGTLDPFDEQGLEPVEGIVHRYPDRALLVLTNFCSTLCRHCMRKREWVGGFRRLRRDAVKEAVAYLGSHPEIRDVLITGGDPLETSLSFLEELLTDLSHLGLDVLRLGSRVPVTLPQRVDKELLSVLQNHSPLYINTHFNHPRELSPRSIQACRDLVAHGVVLGNQSVLLKGVNDDETTLWELSRNLLRAGVRPYYLHHCDPVAGLDHFRVPLERARELVRSLYGKVTGLGIPRLTVDLPGGQGKVSVDLGFDRGRRGERDVFHSPLTGQDVEV